VEEALNTLANAAAKVGGAYFRLPTTYDRRGIIRERVFYYELYHQVRLLVGGSETLSLNGEIDKRGHVDFQREDQKNPDFVWHIPGTHRGNILVIQVKGTLRLGKAKYVADLRTLLRFVTRYHYRAGVFLLYNHTDEELKEKLGITLNRLTKSKGADAVYVMTIARAGVVCRRERLVEAGA
jgi:hypothetical protein